MYRQIKAPFEAMIEEREKKRLKRWELAAEAGIDYNTLRNWENGDTLPNANGLIAVCNVLDIPIDVHLGRRRVND